MSTQRMTIVWMDALGQQTVRTIDSQAGASGLLASLQAASCARPYQTAEGALVVPGGLPFVAQYPSASQVCYLNFTDAGGARAVVALPAPLPGIFVPGSTIVDPASSLAAAILAAAFAELVTSTGTPVTSFYGGQLGRGSVTT